MNTVAALLFAAALVHTFSTPLFLRLAERRPRHARLWHLLGEVELVFALWAVVLLVAIAALQGTGSAFAYATSRSYTEPLFVFVVMVVAASRPVLAVIRGAIDALSLRLPGRTATARTWLCMAAVPLAGSLVTEPAAMTLAALMLAPSLFQADMPERLKYAALGVLFVNVSIGGTLTAFAAPPVLMVAGPWGWDSAFLATHIGWKSAIAVVVNASVVTWLLRRHVADTPPSRDTAVPWHVSAIHVAWLIAVVFSAHHPAWLAVLMVGFLGVARLFARHQSVLILREAALVAVFLAGLVVLGGQQRWWLQPIIGSLEPTALFFGAMGLTAITDNAALTYLGSLVDGLTDPAKLMLVAGAVAGGGLTVIANAPNPAGAALLRHGFRGGAIGAAGLLGGAALPTAVAAAALLLL